MKDGAVLKVFEKQADPKVVSYLESILEEARAGRVRGVLVVEQRDDGFIGYTTAGLEDRFRLTGVLFHALHKLQTDDRG